MPTVADLTVNELREIIRETVRETLLERDPDAGLELRPEIVELLSQPVDERECISIENLAVKHGFKWWCIQLLFSPAATEDFERLESKMQQRTIDRLRWFLDNDVLPQPLEGNFKGLFKLRVGDCRIV
jgi:hypothetical protein